MSADQPAGRIELSTRTVVLPMPKRLAPRGAAAPARRCAARSQTAGCRNECIRGDSGHEGKHRCAAGHTW